MPVLKTLTNIDCEATEDTTSVCNYNPHAIVVTSIQMTKKNQSKLNQDVRKLQSISTIPYMPCLLVHYACQ